MSSSTTTIKGDAFPATRSSLIARVRHASDAEGWRIFHAQYQRLVFQVCVKAGLKKEDAEDVAQEALAAVAKQMPEFTLDRSKGSFRGWLRQITAHKVADFWRKKYREGAVRGELPPAVFDNTADEATLVDSVWDDEWHEYLLHRALEATQKKVTARSFQIFHLSAVKKWSVDQIRETLGLTRTQVYLARFRVGQIVKQEIASLRKELD
jgi:RNA polymerase sigma factor (sigma-70 family)